MRNDGTELNRTDRQSSERKDERRKGLEIEKIKKNEREIRLFPGVIMRVN